MSNQQSPMEQVDFGQIQASQDVLRIQEEAFCGQLNLRGSLQNADFVAVCKKVLGRELPNNNRFVIEKGITVLWYGPDEWFLITPQGAESSLQEALKKELGATFSAVTDTTGGNTVLDISGSAARDLIVKGCPLDLHPSVFSSGQCAQSLIAKTGITLLQYEDEPRYKLIVRRSFADYLGAWLIDAAREFA